MRIILMLLLTFGLYAQTVYTNTFDTFIGNKNADTQLQFIFSKQWQAAYGDSLHEDLSGNGYDAVLNGWTYAQLLDSSYSTGASFYNVSADSFLHFPGATTHYLTVPDQTVLNPQGGSFTMTFAGKFENYDGVTAPELFYKSGTALIRVRVLYPGAATDPYIYLTLINDATTNVFNNLDITGALYTDSLIILSVVIDQPNTEVRTYVNGALKKTTDAPSLAGNIAPTGAWYIGRNTAAALPFYGSMYYVSFANDKLTVPELQRETELVYNAIATNASVNRVYGQWFQTAWSDTIGFPLSDATLGNNQEWVLDVKSKDTDGSGSTNWWIGKKREPKTVVKTVNCSASFENDKVYFGDGFALSSDTLWVAFADTASVDNVVLSKAKHHLIQRKSGWLGW